MEAFQESRGGSYDQPCFADEDLGATGWEQLVGEWQE